MGCCPEKERPTTKAPCSLIGTWLLVSCQATAVDDGEVVRPYGEHPLSLIMYTADGYMSDHDPGPAAV
jgi:hypothetical protein